MKYQNTFWITSIILFLGLISATNTHAENYTFVKQWSLYSNGSGYFESP